jgi:Protein of unknown function (DUF3617)
MGRDWENLMKKQLLIASTAILALAVTGCSSAEEKPRQGKYKPEIELTTLEMPGMTPAIMEQAKAQMKTQFASRAGEQCVKGGKADWKKAADSVSKGFGGNCTTISDKGTDTVADLEMKCTGTPMGDLGIVIKGQAESESFSMDLNMTMSKVPGPAGGQGKIGMKMSAKRIGDC